MENNANYGIGSIVCGVLSWFVLGIVLAPLGLVFGCIGISKDTNKVPAVIGLVVSCIALAVIVFSVLLVANITK